VLIPVAVSLLLRCRMEELQARAWMGYTMQCDAEMMARLRRKNLQVRYDTGSPNLHARLVHNTTQPTGLELILIRPIIPPQLEAASHHGV
jgi:hypothetical protein